MVYDPTTGRSLCSLQEAVKEWLKSHGRERTRPSLDKVIEGLKARGITSFAATGYCFGARYVFDLAFDGVIKAAAVSHPSQLEVPADLEKFKASRVPLLINSCEFDEVYPPEKQKIGDVILGGGQTESEGYKRAYFAGCTHGFAVRGDLSNPVVKKGKEDAFENVVHWFKAHL